MKKILFSVLVLFAAFALKAQDCVSYFPIKEGTVMETKHYNAKDKIQSTDKQTILTKVISGTGVTITSEVENFDDKNVSLGKRNLTYKCENGKFFFDMQNFIDPAAMAGFKDMQLQVDATNLEFPAVLTPGMTLPDGLITIIISNQGMKIMTMTTRIFNRKVEAEEQMTVPAGTYSCYKISYDVESKMMIKVAMKGIDWIAKEVGTVRSETYDSKGKLNGYQVLSMFK